MCVYSIKSFPTCSQNCVKAQTILRFISLNFLLNSTPYTPYFPYFSAFFTLQIGMCFLCGPTDVVLQAWAVHPSSDIDCNCPTPHPLTWTLVCDKSFADTEVSSSYPSIIQSISEDTESAQFQGILNSLPEYDKLRKSYTVNLYQLGLSNLSSKKIFIGNGHLKLTQTILLSYIKCSFQESRFTVDTQTGG